MGYFPKEEKNGGQFASSLPNIISQQQSQLELVFKSKRLFVWNTKGLNESFDLRLELHFPHIVRQYFRLPMIPKSRIFVSVLLPVYR